MRVMVGFYIVWLLQRSNAKPGDEALRTAVLCDAFEDLPDLLEEKRHIWCDNQ